MRDSETNCMCSMPNIRAQSDIESNKYIELPKRIIIVEGQSHNEYGLYKVIIIGLCWNLLPVLALIWYWLTGK